MKIPLLPCSTHTWTFWRNRSESGFWGTSKEDLINREMQESILSTTEVLSIWRVLSKIRGLTLISPPALCHSWWFHSGSVSAGWGIIPSTTLLDYKTKKKKNARWFMFVCVLSGVTSSDMDSVYIQLCRVEEHRLGKSTAAFFPISLFFFFFFWRSPFFGHWFSTTLPFLCPKAINRKQNIGKWSKKSYLFPYQSLVSWVTLSRTWAGCSGVLSLVVLT